MLRIKFNEKLYKGIKCILEVGLITQLSKEGVSKRRFIWATIELFSICNK